MARRTSCPCGTGDQYGDCCRRLHRGEATAETAEQLMRTRFSAFACEDAAYLLRTWHPATRPERIDFDSGIRWTRLEIIDHDAGRADDANGMVEFRAHDETGAGPGVLHETSRFVRQNGDWRYVRGKLLTS